MVFERVRNQSCRFYRQFVTQQVSRAADVLGSVFCLVGLANSYITAAGGTTSVTQSRSSATGALALPTAHLHGLAALLMLMSCTKVEPGPITVVPNPVGGALISGPKISGTFTLNYSVTGYQNADSGGGCLVFQYPGEEKKCEVNSDCQNFAFLPVEDGASAYCADGQQMAKSCWYKPGDLSYCAKYPNGLNVGETMHLPSILAKVPPSQSGTISWRVSTCQNLKPGPSGKPGCGDPFSEADVHYHIEYGPPSSF